MEKLNMTLSKDMNFILEDALHNAVQMHHQFVTPEHVLFAFMREFRFFTAWNSQHLDFEASTQLLRTWFGKLETVPPDVDYTPEPSYQFDEMIAKSCIFAAAMGSKQVEAPHVIKAMSELKESEAAYVLRKGVGNKMPDFLTAVTESYKNSFELSHMKGFYDGDDDYDDEYADDYDEEEEPGRMPQDWHQLVTPISDLAANHNPLIGREEEMERTIQVLCRADKNNPLHIGEAGVGKTALIYGLAERIKNGQVPERLRKARIYGMDMGQMLAGAQYRGDFEKRIKAVMDGATKEGNAIIYLDEIHNMIGAGRGGDGGPDASNMLKPYLEDGTVKFIGSTTYDEYNRHMAKSKGITRRFQQIDIKEPSEEETVRILEGLQPKYQRFHGVTYRKDALEYAVRASAKYITGRALPDKAIDLMDEAGAYLEAHPAQEGTRKRPYVTKALIQQILTKVCKIDAAAMKEESNELLQYLKTNMDAQIYGQESAIKAVVEAVMMAKAGLTDEDKPLASLLFVGPTGVGKTEVARTLAREMGVELVRFDMSEYTEKQTVAKLIGSPAGYVGYEDGGLLTDAIRKTPNCVLLLDEIEKAHSDIYNILLQVMDYARLTDNKGQKADFRNVILIMTSNAGAQYASQASVGFTGHVTRGEAMLAQVKKLFKPEFINRLTDTIVFNDMDKQMAELILRKKLHKLEEKLARKKVTMQLTGQAFEALLSWGYTQEYGAREMDRAINNRLKPILMREMLFARLRKGGKATIDYNGKQLCMK